MTDPTEAPETELEAPSSDEGLGLDTSLDKPGVTLTPDGDGDGKNPPRDDAGRFVPKARFDEGVGRERGRREAAEQQVRELEARLSATERVADVDTLEAEIVQLETRYAESLVDGDPAHTAAIMREIRLRERAVSQRETAALTRRASATTREQVLVETAIEKLVATYPELDERSAAYNEGLEAELLEWQGYYVNAKGMSLSKALTAAAQRVFGGQSPASLPASTRKTDAVEKALRANKAQPPSLTRVGEDSDKHGAVSNEAYLKLSPEQWMALPEATRAKLRGDFA